MVFTEICAMAQLSEAISKTICLLLFFVTDFFKKEESCKENGDTPDSPSAEDNLSMLDGARPSPLCSNNHQRNGGVPEKRSVPVSDTGKGELPGVATAFGKLGIDGT